MYPNSIKNVIDCLKDLPGIGEKTAERLAFSLINFDKDKLTLFSESICGVRDKLTNCQICVIFVRAMFALYAWIKKEMVILYS